MFEDYRVLLSILCLKDELCWHQSTLEERKTEVRVDRCMRHNVMDMNEAQYLKECCSLRYDALDPDLWLQRKRNGLDL